MRQARTAARFEGTPAGIRHGAPQLGENTDDVLLDAGLSDHEIAALRESGIVGGWSADKLDLKDFRVVREGATECGAVRTPVHKIGPVHAREFDVGGLAEHGG